MKQSAETRDFVPDDLASSSFDGLETEHILIEDELSAGDAKPVTVADRKIIKNGVRGTVTELTIFEEGFLRVREGTARKPIKNHLIEIQFLDPKFKTRRQFARGWLWLMLGATAAAALAWLLMPLLGLAPFRPYAAALCGAVAVFALYRLVLDSREQKIFVTARGRAVVLTLDANIGCLGKTRRAAVAVSRAIKRAAGDRRSGDARYLRAEMQAHYRLLETGVITKDACSNSTAQILARFD